MGQLCTLIRLPEYLEQAVRGFDVELLAHWAISSPARLVVITGGEPLRQAKQLLALTARLVELGVRVEIHSPATVVPPGELLASGAWFVVGADAGAVEPALAGFAEAERAAFRAPARTSEDIDALARAAYRHSLHPLWLDTDHEHTTPWLAQQAAAHGWNLAAHLGPIQ